MKTTITKNLNTYTRTNSTNETAYISFIIRKDTDGGGEDSIYLNSKEELIDFLICHYAFYPNPSHIDMLPNNFPISLDTWKEVSIKSMRSNFDTLGLMRNGEMVNGYIGFPVTKSTALKTVDK